VVTVGVEGDAPTLLLLHDRGRTSEQWREFVPLLESRFRVVAPELSSGDHSAEMELVREAVGVDRFGVIGHGTGGALALVLARQGGVEAMVLLDAQRADGVTDEDLASFDFPVLLLWGEDDDVVPVSVAEELNDAIPTSTLGLLPGCGHDLTDEAAATIGPMILEYLRARYLKAPHQHEHAHEGIVRIQLERRPPWVDLEEDERDDWFDVPDGDEEAAP
jgi:pimeloyl-ACP methyl ester carboxylesterase